MKRRRARAKRQTRSAGPLAICIATLTFVAVWLAGMPEASACGGLFCNNQQPVRQSAEQIIFSENMDGTVTAVIQIRYQGPSEQFAWLLPVPGKPDVGVSSNTALSRMDSATQPSYQLETTVDGKCKEPRDPLFGGGIAAPQADSANVRGTGEDEKVNEIDSGSVGPYDYTTISVKENTDEPAKQALDWLKMNGYDLTDIGPDLIREYLNDDMNLVAIKLTSTSNTGDIRPLKVTYEHPLPMIPIKLTAVAANQDMGVLVWLMGRHRGVPTKYKHLKINDAAINWFNWRSNYDQVITQAASEAGGRGFVTEYADEASELHGTILSDDERQAWKDFNDAEKWQQREGKMVNDALNRWRSWDGMRKALSMTLPENVQVQPLITQQGREYKPGVADIEGLEVQAFLDAIDKFVIGPMVETEDLLRERAYVSRLYTTMSPDEMSVDPIFDFNKELPDVSNVHTAQRTVVCSRAVFRSEAPWRAVLPSGATVRGRGNRWPVGPNSSNAGEMPMTRKIETTGATGEPNVEENNEQAIQQALEDYNSTISLDPGGCGGCSTSGDSAPLSALVLLSIAGGFALRRRRD